VSVTTLTPGARIADGVRVHPNGKSLEVRVRPYKPVAGFPLHDPDRAVDYAIALRKRRAAGDLTPPGPVEVEVGDRTLADATRDHLTDLETIGGRQGNAYGATGMKAARRDARPWLGQSIPPRFGKGHDDDGRPIILEAPEPVDELGRPFGLIALDELRGAPIGDYLRKRHAVTPRAAVGERQMLLAVVERELGRGHRIDASVLAGLPRLKRATVKRSCMRLAEFDYMTRHTPDHQRRGLWLGCTLGGRIMELLQAEDAWLDLEAGTITIPAWACKERREKELDLLAEELMLIREQQLIRSPNTARGKLGTRLLFPRRDGGRWRHANYFDRVVVRMRHRAALAWREEHDLGPDAPTPFEWIVRDRDGDVVLADDGTPKVGGFQPHDLRRGAATILRELRVPHELIAARLGHKDAGYLVAVTYAETRRDALRDELARIDAAGGIRAALEAARAAGGES
jgi:integrase